MFSSYQPATTHFSNVSVSLRDLKQRTWMPLILNGIGCIRSRISQRLNAVVITFGNDIPTIPGRSEECLEFDTPP